MGHAAQAVVALAAEAAAPRLRTERRRRPEDGAGGPQGAPLQGVRPDGFASRAVERAGQRAEVVEVLLRVGERDEPVRAAVLDEALDEARPGGLAAHDGLAVDPESVGLVAQRAVRPRALRVLGHLCVGNCIRRLWKCTQYLR